MSVNSDMLQRIGIPIASVNFDIMPTYYRETQSVLQPEIMCDRTHSCLMSRSRMVIYWWSRRKIRHSDK